MPTDGSSRWLLPVFVVAALHCFVRTVSSSSPYLAETLPKRRAAKRSFSAPRLSTLQQTQIQELQVLERNVPFCNLTGGSLAGENNLFLVTQCVGHARETFGRLTENFLCHSRIRSLCSLGRAQAGGKFWLCQCPGVRQCGAGL